MPRTRLIITPIRPNGEGEARAVGNAGNHIAPQPVGAHQEYALLFVGHVQTEKLRGHGNFTPQLIILALGEKANGMADGRILSVGIAERLRVPLAHGLINKGHMPVAIGIDDVNRRRRVQLILDELGFRVVGRHELTESRDQIED